MPITIDGSGTITGLSAGGLPDATIVQADLATGVAGTGPAFSAYQSTGQSLTNSTFTKIQFQTEEFDTNNNFDSTTNYRFTPTVAGYYQVSGCFNPTVTANNILIVLSIYKNGSRFKDFSGISTTGSGGLINGSALIFLNGSTDYVELYGFQLSGATTTITAGVNPTYFQACLVRGA